MKQIKYKVVWGGSYSQDNLSKTKALEIAGELLNNYSNVEIITYYKS